MAETPQPPAPRGEISWETLLSTDWSGLEPSDFKSLAAWNPELSETIRRAASSSLLGQGREVDDETHAVKLLGAARVRHIALWFRMRELFGDDEDGAAECVTTAAATLVVAEAYRRPPFGAITLGFGARLGQRLLLTDSANPSVVGALLERIHPARREKFEHRMFGSTAQNRFHQAIRSWDLPKDLQELLNPPWHSTARRLIDDGLELLASKETNVSSERLPAVAQRLGEILQVAGCPWHRPPARPMDILLLVAQFQDQAQQARQALVEKDCVSQLYRNLLDLRDPELPEDVPRPTQMAQSLATEVSRAMREERRLSVVGVCLDPRQSRPEGIPPQEILADMARNLRRATRSIDHVGFLDSETLLVLLQDTDLNGARLFGDRAYQRLETGKTPGHPSALLYTTSLAQEPTPGSDALICRILEGLAGMADDTNRVHFRWNEAWPGVKRVR